MQPVWGMNPLNLDAHIKSEMEKSSAAISAAAANIANAQTHPFGGHLTKEDWEPIQRETDALKADIQTNMTRFNEERLLENGVFETDTANLATQTQRTIRGPLHGNRLTQRLDSTATELFNTTSDQVMLRILSSEGYFQVQERDRESRIDRSQELQDCIEAIEAHQRAAAVYRAGELAKELSRKMLLDALLLDALSLLDDVTPQAIPPSRLQMNLVINELLTRPPHLKHIKPPEK